MKQFNYTLMAIVVLAMMSMTAQAQERVNKLDSIVNSWSKHFQFHGYALTGWQYHEYNHPSNEFAVSKVILFTDITVTPRITGRVMFNLAKASLLETWGAYKFADEVNVKVGQFKTPFSLENPYSPTVLELITEDALVTQYMVMGANPLMLPGSGGRDIGLTIYGNLFNKHIAYDLAVMNGAGRNQSDINSAKDFVARLNVKPVKQLEVGGSLILGRGTHESMGGRFKRNRYAASAQLTTMPFVLRSEYMWGVDGKQHSNGGYVTAAVKNVGAKGLDLATTIDHLKTPEVTTNRYSVGASYWFYPKCRLQLGYNYVRAHHDGASSVLTQLQLAF